MKKIMELYGFDVFLPNAHGVQRSPVKLDDPTYLLVKSIDKDSILLETTSGPQIARSLDDLIKLCNHASVFISTNTLDILLKWCTPKIIQSLLPPFSKGGFSLNGHNIKYIPGLHGAKIDNSRIIKVNNYLPRNYRLETLNDVKDVADKLTFISQSGITFSHLSPASTVSATLLNTLTKKDMNLTQVFTKQDLELIMKSYHTLRQDNAFVGTYKELQAIDMHRAFLTVLKKLKSFSKRCNIVDRKPRKNKDAWNGWYKIQTENPRGLRFPFFPYRRESNEIYERDVYPEGGPFDTYVHKSYLDAADELEIPYKILQAVQLISTDIEYPFEDFCNAILYITEYMQEQLKPITTKSLYFSVIGHMLHYHYQELPNDERGFVTSADFHPAIATTVVSIVNNEVYKLLYTSINPYFISADGGGAKLFPRIPKAFQDLGTGIGFSLDPCLKDKPGKTPAHNIGPILELVKQYRDKTYIPLKLPILHTAFNSWDCPSRIGTTGFKTTRRPPNCGTRILKEMPKKLGYLLDRLFPSTPPIFLSDGLTNATPYEPLSRSEISYLLEAEE